MSAFKNRIQQYLIKKMLRAYKRDKFEILKPIIKYLTSNWFLKRKVIDLACYSTLNSEKVEFLFEREIDLVFSDVAFYPDTGRKLFNTSGIEYAAQLRDVKVIGGSSLIPLNKEYVLYDIKTQDKTGNVRYSDEGVVHSKGNEFFILCRENLENIPVGIFFIGNYSFNYFHFLYEVMVKSRTLGELNLDSDIPLLIDESFLKVPQYTEILKYLNLNRTIVPIKKHGVYNVEKLYYISCPNIIAPNFLEIDKIKPSSVLFNPDSIFFLRDKLLKLKSNSGNFSKRVFISRKNASKYRGYNESEIFEVLKKFDFRIYHPEALSIGEQVELFNNAELIVGATGAAFSNLLFCTDKCNVICMTNFSINLTIFSTIAKLNNVNLTYLYDDSLLLNPHSDLQMPFNIKPNVLENLIKNFIN